MYFDILFINHALCEVKAQNIQTKRPLLFEMFSFAGSIHLSTA